MIKMIKKVLILSLIVTIGIAALALSMSIIDSKLSLKSFIGLFGILFFGMSTYVCVQDYIDKYM